MQELQSDDFYLPAFLLKLPKEPAADWKDKKRVPFYENSNEDFLKDIQGWTEYLPLDECAE
jgi:hypothetical protein